MRFYWQVMRDRVGFFGAQPREPLTAGSGPNPLKFVGRPLARRGGDSRSGEHQRRPTHAAASAAQLRGASSSLVATAKRRMCVGRASASCASGSCGAAFVRALEHPPRRGKHGAAMKARGADDDVDWGSFVDIRWQARAWRCRAQCRAQPWWWSAELGLGGRAWLRDGPCIMDHEEIWMEAQSRRARRKSAGGAVESRCGREMARDGSWQRCEA